MTEKLTPIEQAELKFYRSRVDFCQDEAMSTTPPRNAQQELYAARRELKKYVEKLREKGRQI